MARFSIRYPELLTVVEGEDRWRGCDQDWFPQQRQRYSGCGPTSAAVLVSYLASTHEDYSALYPSRSNRRDDIVELMEETWQYITPGNMGVNSAKYYADGLRSFLRDRGSALTVEELEILGPREARPTLDDCTGFIRAGLEADAPVPWLVLDPGGESRLDEWHWITIFAMEESGDGNVACSYLDSGEERTADFRLWLETTGLGGGLVRVHG